MICRRKLLGLEEGVLMHTILGVARSRRARQLATLADALADALADYLRQTPKLNTVLDRLGSRSRISGALASRTGASDRPA